MVGVCECEKRDANEGADLGKCREVLLKNETAYFNVADPLGYAGQVRVGDGGLGIGHDGLQQREPVPLRALYPVRCEKVRVVFEGCGDRVLVLRGEKAEVEFRIDCASGTEGLQSQARQLY